jgi:dipeptidase E
MRLLLLSNSTNAGEEFLSHALKEINSFIGSGTKNILFIPYAAISIHYDEYADKVSRTFNRPGYKFASLHTFTNPAKAIEEADIIVTGGGNTWHLLHTLQIKKLLSVIRAKVLGGTPFIGWSAGSNICCPTIRTTNDMPVVECESLAALNLIPFQINPHYFNINPDGFSGETREDRLREFILMNRNIYVVGLREGTMLLIEKEKLKLIGEKPASLFHYGKDIIEINNGDDVTFLLNYH